jgi:SAM-dependent methyltransferase
MSDQFDVNQYWLKRARSGTEEEPRYAGYHRLQEQFLFDTLRKGPVPMRNILEAGCGWGRVTRLLAEHYREAQIAALDLSPDYIEVAKRYCAGVGNIAFHRYDFYSAAPFPGANYDAAVAVEVFLHHPRTLVRALVERLSAAALYVVNIDWSEAWPWKTPEHVWVHDYQAIYAEAGLNCATFTLPEKIEGMQQKLFIASRRMTHQMVHLMEMAAAATSAQNAAEIAGGVSGAEHWAQALQHATAEILQLVPAGSRFILVNDDQWGNESELNGRQVIPFLEHEGRYWGPPDNDRTAIQELERLRQAGASHIVFAWPSFWWLDYYSGFRNHLQSNYPCLVSNQRLVAFGLQSAAPA